MNWHKDRSSKNSLLPGIALISAVLFSKGAIGAIIVPVG